MTSLTVEEGESASYTVSLATRAHCVAVTVTITAVIRAPTSLSAGPTLNNGTLTFTAADWTMPQTVTVTAAHDDDTEDDIEVLT